MPWILLILLLTLSVAATIAAVRYRRRRHHERLHGPVALLGSLTAPTGRPLPRPTLTRRMPATLRRTRDAYATPPQDPFQVTTSYAPPPPPPAPERESAGNGIGGDGGSGDDGEVIRYVRPSDRTLQFLPGRLEVVGGREAGTSIRFVRTGGPDGTSVSFGRGDGPPYRHVSLNVPTVSRQHARMRWDGTHWTLTNLSGTNPVILNGVALPGSGSAADLADGDRVEMGEIVFRFHAE
ncbi:MAG: FHA domain-containing protein, partial [Gemmatimonadaceae bacterium]